MARAISVVADSWKSATELRRSPAALPHYYNNYGTPGDTPEGNCNGGHTNECARYATADVLPRLRAVLANPK